MDSKIQGNQHSKKNRLSKNTEREKRHFNN
jgi:hypothetical protein